MALHNISSSFHKSFHEKFQTYQQQPATFGKEKSLTRALSKISDDTTKQWVKSRNVGKFGHLLNSVSYNSYSSIRDRFGTGVSATRLSSKFRALKEKNSSDHVRGSEYGTYIQNLDSEAANKANIKALAKSVKAISANNHSEISETLHRMDDSLSKIGHSALRKHLQDKYISPVLKKYDEAIRKENDDLLKLSRGIFLDGSDYRLDHTAFNFGERINNFPSSRRVNERDVPTDKERIANIFENAIVHSTQLDASFKETIKQIRHHGNIANRAAEKGEVGPEASYSTYQVKNLLERLQNPGLKNYLEQRYLLPHAANMEEYDSSIVNFAHHPQDKQALRDIQYSIGQLSQESASPEASYQKLSFYKKNIEDNIKILPRQLQDKASYMYVHTASKLMAHVENKATSLEHLNEADKSIMFEVTRLLGNLSSAKNITDDNIEHFAEIAKSRQQLHELINSMENGPFKAQLTRFQFEKSEAIFDDILHNEKLTIRKKLNDWNSKRLTLSRAERSRNFDEVMKRIAFIAKYGSDGDRNTKEVVEYSKKAMLIQKGKPFPDPDPKETYIDINRRVLSLGPVIWMQNKGWWMPPKHLLPAPKNNVS